ncbi:MAG: potassium/proton antiporter, partial [Clostridium sp.]|nr:potassium/proton antiporter [Clostridium sp.]
IAYMLTLIVLTFMSNTGVGSMVPMIIKQIVFGILIGSILAKGAVYVIRRANFEVEGFYTIFITAIAILSYAVSEWLGGNGYLSVYMAGIIIGNSKIPHKKSLFHFFDGVSWIMQIALFFILGLLSFPSKLPQVVGISIAISIFMIVIARPLATFIILSKFNYSVKEKIFISWVGLRGAASIVFAIFSITYGVNIQNDIFHIVFFIALLSVAIQGTLIPKVAQKLDLVDDSTPVLRTFNDYKEDKSTKLLEVNIFDDSKWVNKTIMDSDIPEDILIVMIKRGDEVIVPKGSTIINKGDILVLSANNFDNLLNN